MTLCLPDTEETRVAVIDACLWMNSSGLNRGTSGNVSVRLETGVLVTPSGIPYDRIEPDMLQVIPAEGEPAPSGRLRPTTEWRFHQSILAARSDMVAVVHAHPAHASAVAIQRRAIPACHYMVAALGGTDVPLVGYSLFGSPELAEMVAAAMKDRTGCLMANHGAVAAGETLDRALWRMEEIENLARVYLLSQINGTPVILDDAEMAEVLEAISNYGPPSEN